MPATKTRKTYGEDSIDESREMRKHFAVIDDAEVCRLRRMEGIIADLLAVPCKADVLSCLNELRGLLTEGR